MSKSDVVLRMMGAMIVHEIDLEVIRLFTPGSITELVEGASQAQRERSIIPPGLGQLLNRSEWSPTNVLPVFVCHCIWLAPGADSRSHLVGGLAAMSLARFWTEDRRRVIATMIDQTVMFTKSTELYEAAGDSARVILGAYDQGLAMAESTLGLDNYSAESEGHQ